MLPAGKVADIVTEGKAEVKSKKGNTISKNASKDDPAVVIERSGVSTRIITPDPSTPIYRSSGLQTIDPSSIAIAPSMHADCVLE